MWPTARQDAGQPSTTAPPRCDASAMNTAIDTISARIRELLSERDYLRRTGEGAGELDLEIGRLQLSRAVIVAYLRHGLDA